MYQNKQVFTYIYIYTHTENSFLIALPFWVRHCLKPPCSKEFYLLIMVAGKTYPRKESIFSNKTFVPMVFLSWNVIFLLVIFIIFFKILLRIHTQGIDHHHHRLVQNLFIIVKHSLHKFVGLTYFIWHFQLIPSDNNATKQDAAPLLSKPLLNCV